MILTHLPKFSIYTTLGLTLLSVFLYLIRVLDTGRLTFFYMIWNLLLAIIPLLLSQLLITYFFHKKNRPKKAILVLIFILWLAFLPNAPYLITDLIHLKLRDSTPLWFDLLFLQAMALSGILLWVLSLYQVVQIFTHKHNQRYTNTYILIIISLSSFGVALGRFFRFNSWDAFIAPHKILEILFHSGNSTIKIMETIIFGIILFFVLTCIYFFFAGFATKSKTDR